MAKSTIIQEMQNLPEKDLAKRIAEEKKRYIKMKHVHAITPLESSALIKKLRRDIARMCQLLDHQKKEYASSQS